MFNPITRYPLAITGFIAVVAIAGTVGAGVQSHVRGVDLVRTQGTLSQTRASLADTAGKLTVSDERVVALTADVAAAESSADQARAEVASGKETIENLRACALGMGQSASAILDEDYLGARVYLDLVTTKCREGAAGAGDEDSADSASF